MLYYIILYLNPSDPKSTSAINDQARLKKLNTLCPSSVSSNIKSIERIYPLAINKALFKIPGS